MTSLTTVPGAPPLSEASPDTRRPTPDAASCVSCGQPAGTPFCPHCGEGSPASRRYHFREFIAEAFETVTNADGRLWRTFATLVRRPGELTHAYMIGRRQPYMRPLQLFLIVNVVYFVWASFVGERVFDTRYQNHLANTNYGPGAIELVRARLAERGVTEATYRTIFDAAATVQAKSLIIAMVPMFALLVAILEVRRRRPVVQHLVFALHAYTMLLLLSIAQRYAVHWPVRGVAALFGATVPWSVLDPLIAWAIVLAFSTWLVFGLRRAYGDRLPWALAKGAVLGGSLLFILVTYRMLLFYSVFYTT